MIELYYSDYYEGDGVVSPVSRVKRRPGPNKGLVQEADKNRARAGFNCFLF